MTLQSLTNVFNINDMKFIRTDAKQHDLYKLADIVANEIFNGDGLSDAKTLEANEVRNRLRIVIHTALCEAVDDEKDKLASNNDHCLSDINAVGGETNYVIDRIKQFQVNSWTDLLASRHWQDAARSVIGTMIATVRDIERKNYADEHPTNKAALFYKIRGQ